MNRAVALVLVLIAIVALPIAVRCEVMDKEPTIASFWATAILGGGVGALLWRLRRWAGVISLVLPTILFSQTYRELRDPFVGPDILREAGPEYERNFWLALGTFVLLQALGAVWWGYSRRRRSKATHEAVAADVVAAGPSA